MTKEKEEIIVRPKRGFKALAPGAVSTVSQAALTVDRTDLIPVGGQIKNQVPLGFG